MQCPKCSSVKTKVRVSLPFTDEGEPRVVRQRICDVCKKKFKTIEKPVREEDGTIRSDKGSD